MKQSKEDGQNSGNAQRSSNALSEERTDLSHDRTLLANERTYGSWLRTGIGTLAIGLGFQRLFDDIDPTWLIKIIATIFVSISITMIIMAYQRYRAVQKRISGHNVASPPEFTLKLMSAALLAAAIGAIFIIWYL